MYNNIVYFKFCNSTVIFPSCGDYIEVWRYKLLHQVPDLQGFVKFPLSAVPSCRKTKQTFHLRHFDNVINVFPPTIWSKYCPCLFKK